MFYKVLVVLHLLGAATWVGGHIVLVLSVLPAALKKHDPKSIVEFEQGYGKVGLLAMALQLITGAWLASFWLGGWGNIFNSSVPASRLVLIKLALLIATLGQAGHAYHRILPRLRAEATDPLGGTPSALRTFAVHASITTVFAVLMLVVGASIRLGGFS
ncbi:MAG: CopD family protein [Phycisphaerae bacterium]|nr:CopD family protein [Phycisphaerae bacterium]